MSYGITENETKTAYYLKMRHLSRLISLIAFALFIPASMQAYSVRGRVVDEHGDGLSQASVRLLSAKDSVRIQSAATNDNGRFNFGEVKNGKYIIEASYVGYDKIFRDVTVNGKDVAVGKISLAENALNLKAMTVTGVRPAIKVMEDTIEYTADSYKTAPNAVVEDVLKRLPGVEIGSDGSITSNGKTVSKILVDGKEFFADDPKVASKNLPASMVDKVQVVDRKSDLARLTGVDDGEEETVINLTVKKGMKNGWFGNAEAGYGTDSRYKGNFIVNRFWKDNQFTFLGNLNNINELGFSDGANGRFMRFGGMNGITRSQNFGFNFNVGNGEIFRVGGNVMYSGTRRETQQTTHRQRLATSNTENIEKYALDRGHNFRADFRMLWNPDSATTVEFRPNISYNQNKSYSHDQSETLSGDGSPVNRNTNTDMSNGKSFEFGGRVIFNRKLSKPGRSFSTFVNYRLSNVREKTDAYSWIRYYMNDETDEDVEAYDQWVNNHTWSNSISARLSWTEPLGDARNGNFLTLAYNFSYRWNDADKLTYDRPVDFEDGYDNPPLIGDELTLNEVLSNRFRNDYMNQDIRFGYKKVTKKINFEGGLSLVPQMSKSINLMDDARTIPARHVFNIAPYLRLRYKHSNTTSANINYRGRSSQPSMTQLQPVADMTDPLRVVIGNPDLKPTFTHNLNIRYQNFNSAAQRSIMLMANISMAQNSIVSRTEYNASTGGQVTTYENVNGVWSAMGMNMISFPLKNRSFTINNHLMARYSRSVGFVDNNKNKVGTLNINESIGFAWRPENASFELRPLYGIQTVSNSINKKDDRTVHNYGGMFDGTYYTPIGIVLQTDLNYTATSGYSQGYDSKQWMWNASISYQFLREKNATLTLKAYDLLRQKSNIRQTANAQYIEDTRYNSLTRYFMITFSYKFNTFKKGEQPTDRNAPRFGPGMGPGAGGGRPPMGPPPGR